MISKSFVRPDFKNASLPPISWNTLPVPERNPTYCFFTSGARIAAWASPKGAIIDFSTSNNSDDVVAGVIFARFSATTLLQSVCLSSKEM